MRRFLLSDLPEDRRASIEDAFIRDESVFAELLAAENDLIDAYVRDELSVDEHRKFEVAYLTSPRRRERVEFARALQQVAAEARQNFQFPRVSFWERVRAALTARFEIPRLVMAVAGLVVVVSGSWVLMQFRNLHSELRRDSAEQAELRNDADALRRKLGNSEGSTSNKSGTEVASLEPPKGSEIVFSLIPGEESRGPGTGQKTLTIAPGVSQVRLDIELDREDYQSYLAVLTDQDGRVLTRSKPLKRASTSSEVEWSLPAGSLRTGVYIVELKGLLPSGEAEEAGSYDLSVSRK